MLKRVSKAYSYQEYLGMCPKDMQGNIALAKTYVELPKELWKEFRDKGYRTAGHQVGELIFQALKETK